jgi:predicted dehydrogenase
LIKLKNNQDIFTRKHALDERGEQDLDKFKWAYIGAGSIANTTAKSIMKSGNHEIVSVWNRTKLKAEKFAEQFGSTVYDKAEDAMNDPRVEGVYISVTADQHEKYVLMALSYRKAVMIEKPFAANLNQAIHMFDVAREQNTYLTEAMWTWYNDIAHQTKAILKQGLIGEIKKVKIVMGFPLVTFFKIERLTDLSRCGGALMDVGVYPVHHALELFGYPLHIKCTGKIVDGVDLYESIELDYLEYKVQIQVAIDRLLGEYMTIEGSQGFMKVPRFHNANKTKIRVNRQIKIDKNSSHNNQELYTIQFDRVAEEIRKGKLTSDWVTPESVLSTMRILDECRKQMHVKFPFE